MRLTELITRVREKVADARSLYWTDVQITRDLNLWQRSLFRRKSTANDSYGARLLDISAVDNAPQIKQVGSAEWVYTMPSWVYRVHSVTTLVNGVESGDIPFATAGATTGWSWHSNRGISIRGNSLAQDIRLRVVKLPSLMFRGTCAVNGSDPSMIVIPASLAIESGQTEAFALELEEGALLGASIEVTSADASHDPRGVIGQVIEQRRVYNPVVPAYQLELTVLPAFADFVKAGDTFETHSEIEDVHANLLVLRTAESTLHKTNNLAGINALQPQIAKEEKDFGDSLQPRTGTAYHIMATEDSDFERRDVERDAALRNW